MSGASADHLREPPAEPEVNQRWTSDREWDRLAPLTMSLQHWSSVYDRWRLHELASVRPVQPRFDRADLSAVDELRGVHLGRLAALSRRLRTAAAALIRIAGSVAACGTALNEAWRDGAAQRAVLRLDRLEHDTQDCAAVCARFGLHLECAIVDTVAPVITGAVEEILARCRGWQQACEQTSRQVWEQRIAALDAGRPADPAGQWRAELDSLVIHYDAAIGVFRATVAAATATISEVYRALHREFGSGVENLAGSDPAATAAAPVTPVPAPAPVTPVPAHAASAPPPADAAPASTMLASADPVGTDEPSAASSSAGGGGGAGADGGGASGGEAGADGGGASGGAVADGSALLGELGEPPVAVPGDATLASPSDGPGYGAGIATAGAGGPAGVLGATVDDQPRGGRSWPGAVGEDREREASWARLRALLGEDAGEHSEAGGTGR